MKSYRYFKLLCIASILVTCILFVISLHSQSHNIYPRLKENQNSSKTITNSSVGRGKTSTLKDRAKNGCPMLSLAQLEAAKTSKNKIPLVLHQVFIYESDNVPQQYVPLLQGCRKVNHDLIYVFWSKQSAAQFIDKFYPKYKDLYQSYFQNVMKSDFIRALILYHFGGIYADMDMECKKPFSEHLDKFNAGAIIDQERRMQTRVFHNMNFTAMNSVLIAQKKHPFFKRYVEGFRAQLKHGNVLWKTGPFYLNDAYKEYSRQNKTGLAKVHLASPYCFSPLVDAGAIYLFQGRCKGPYAKMGAILRLGCIEWDKQGRKQDNIESLVKDSILVHQFMHLAYDFAARGVKKRVDPCKVLDIYKPLL